VPGPNGLRDMECEAVKLVGTMTAIEDGGCYERHAIMAITDVCLEDSWFAEGVRR